MLQELHSVVDSCQQEVNDDLIFLPQIGTTSINIPFLLLGVCTVGLLQKHVAVLVLLQEMI